jgi:hypothetical protein
MRKMTALFMMFPLIEKNQVSNIQEQFTMEVAIFQQSFHLSPIASLPSPINSADLTSFKQSTIFLACVLTDEKL